MMPFSDARFPGDAKASHFQLVLRRRPDGKLPELDQDAKEELSQIIAYLESLRENPKEAGLWEVKEESGRSAKTGKEAAVAPPRLTLPYQRSLRSKMLRAARLRLMPKFSDPDTLTRGDLLSELALLTDSKLPADDIAASETKPTGSGSAIRVEPESEALATPSAQEPASRAASKGAARRWVTPAVTAMVALLGSTVFFLTHPAAGPREDHPTAPTPAPGAAVSAEASRMADRVLRSIQRGRLEEASGLLATAQKSGLVLPGLRYQAALLALRQGDARTSMEWLSQSIAARDAVPECLYLRANSAATNGDYGVVCDSFEEAAGFAAFSPRYFFFWGEALRRYGHPAQALPQLERALLCRPSTADADLIRFKEGLAEIEAGADEKFEAHLQSLLAQKNVPGDVWLLAAAVEINRAAYPAAAEYLQRAKQAMPPALLSARLRDFLFQTRARQPDLAAAWPTAIPAGPVNPDPQVHARVVIDPATRSLAEADPAVW